MADQVNGSVSTVPMPSWIEASLFEKVVKECIQDYRSIQNFAVKPGSTAGENYATLMLRVEIEVELKDGSTQPLSFMMKTCHNNDFMQAFLKSHNMFDIERCMYVDIIPAFEKLYADAGIDITFGPKSYEVDTKENYILLENLTPKGFKNVNRLEGLDTEHCEHVLRKLAMWHAASAVYAANNSSYEDKYLHGFFQEEARDMMETMQANFAPTFEKCIKEYTNYEEYGNDLEHCFKNMIDEMFLAAKCDPNEFNVLNHGDCWANNIMFQYDDLGKIQETYLIDYQIPKYGTPAQDLYYFLLSSSKYEIKLHKFDYFIRFYHDNLSKNLKILEYSKKIPTLCDIHKMLIKYSIFGLSTATGVMAIVLLDPNESASMENFISESETGDAFRIQMYTNARYRKHFEAILPWLQNRGAISF